MATRQYIGARYVPKFAEPILHDSSLTYEPLIIVLDGSGNSYTSKTFVPANIDLTNTTYWVKTGDYNAQVELYRNEVSDLSDKISNSITNPDDFTGTDTQKLQAAIDSLLTSGGTIQINRKYTLTDNIIISHHTDDTNNQIRLVGVNSECGIDMQAYSFVANTEGTWDYGGLIFENLTFTGTGTCIIADRLIRIYIVNCIFNTFNKVLSTGSSYIQQYTFIDCTFRNIDYAVLYINHDVYDIHFIACTCERSGRFIEQVDSTHAILKMDVNFSLIESVTNAAIKICSGYNISIQDCFFEANGIDIDLSDGYYLKNVSIKNNTSDLRTSDKYMISMPEETANLLGEISNNTARGAGGFLHFETSGSGTVKVNLHDNTFNNQYVGAIRNTIQYSNVLAPMKYKQSTVAAQNHTFSAANTWELCEIEVEVPANSYYEILLAQSYSANQPTGVALAVSNNVWDIFASSEGGRLRHFGINRSNYPTTFKVFARCYGAVTNPVSATLWTHQMFTQSTE